VIHPGRAFLGELSYGGYQEVGFQKVPLVEGSTEVKTGRPPFRADTPLETLMRAVEGGAAARQRAEQRERKARRAPEGPGKKKPKGPPKEGPSPGEPDGDG
jgi:hypothetical protein